MKWTTLIGALSALSISCAANGCATTGPSPSSTPSSSSAKLEPGGLVALPSPRDPLVSMRLMFRTGSIDDPKGKEGITSLTAELMAEGGTKSLTSAQLLDALYPMAAELSVQVDKEATTFIGRVHKDNLERFGAIMAEVLTAPRFEPADFDRLKTEGLKLIQVGLRSDDDEALGKAGLEAFLYPNHPYGHPTVGTVSGLSSVTLEEVKGYAAKVFTRDRLTIGLAGGYPAEFPAKFEALLASLPAKGVAPVSLPAPEAATKTEVLVIQKETASTAISIGFPYPVTRANPAEYAAMRLVSSYLGEHRQGAGILFQRMRGARGLNYGDYAYGEAFVQEGWMQNALHNIPRSQQFFSIWIRPVPAQQGLFSLRTAMREFDQLVARGLTKDEFERTRSYLLGYSKLWEQTPDRRLGYALDGRFYGALPDLEAFRQALKGLTLEQVNQVLKKSLTQPGLRVAVVTKDAAEFAAALKANSVSPIQYTSPKAQSILDEDKLIQVYDLRINPDRVKVVKAEEMFER